MVCQKIENYLITSTYKIWRCRRRAQPIRLEDLSKVITDLESEMDRSQIEKVFDILSQNYPLFSEHDNEWMSDGVNSTPFKNSVSVTLSTMTHTKRVIRAAVELFSEVSTPHELEQLTDEHLREIFKPVAHYSRKKITLKEMCRQQIEKQGCKVPQFRE